MIQGAQKPDEDPLILLKVGTYSCMRSFALFLKYQSDTYRGCFCFLSQTMIKHRRINCLTHPVCFAAMNKKW